MKKQFLFLMLFAGFHSNVHSSQSSHRLQPVEIFNGLTHGGLAGRYFHDAFTSKDTYEALPHALMGSLELAIAVTSVRRSDYDTSLVYTNPNTAVVFAFGCIAMQRCIRNATFARNHTSLSTPIAS